MACNGEAHDPIVYELIVSSTTMARVPHTVDRAQGYTNAYNIYNRLNTSATHPGSAAALTFTNFLVGSRPGRLRFIFGDDSGGRRAAPEAALTNPSACGNISLSGYKPGCTCADRTMISQCGKTLACATLSGPDKQACCTSKEDASLQSFSAP